MANTYHHRDSNNKLFFLTELIPVAICCTDRDGNITYYNKQAAKLWGRQPKINDPEELKYCGAVEIFDLNGSRIKNADTPLAIALRTGIPVRNKEIIIKRPDNTKKAVLAHVDLLYNGKNEVTGAINILFDVTDRKKVEKDTFHLASIVESSDDAIISKTLKGEITSWNRAAEKIFGYKQEEVLGKNITILIPPEKLEEEDVIIKNIRKGEKIHHFDTIRMKKNGERIHVSLSVSPIKNAEGEVIGASKIARDITDKVLIDKRIKRYNEQLRKLNRHKDEFISLASHELKTPLTVVKAHLELLSNNARDCDLQSIERTQLHVDRMIHLINKMFDVTRLDSNNIKLDYSRFKIDDLIKDSIKSMSVINNTYDIVYSNAKPHIVISADRERIEQVLINLLINAIKYSPGKNKVHLDVIHHREDIEVQITDFGIGMPPDQTNKIFRRFYRMEGLGKHIAGLGVGLYISRQIIEKHNGRIWVRNSEPGKGSTFCFLLPKEPVIPQIL